MAGTGHRPRDSGTSKLTLGAKVLAVAFPIILGRPREKKRGQPVTPAATSQHWRTVKSFSSLLYAQ